MQYFKKTLEQILNNIGFHDEEDEEEKKEIKLENEKEGELIPNILEKFSFKKLKSRKTLRSDEKHILKRKETSVKQLPHIDTSKHFPIVKQIF